MTVSQVGGIRWCRRRTSTRSRRRACSSRGTIPTSCPVGRAGRVCTRAFTCTTTVPGPMGRPSTAASLTGQSRPGRWAMTRCCLAIPTRRWTREVYRSNIPRLAMMKVYCPASDPLSIWARCARTGVSTCGRRDTNYPRSMALLTACAILARQQRQRQHPSPLPRNTPTHTSW